MFLLPAWAQLEAGLKKLAEATEPEKIYLQYDKPAYTPGETIWFKAYLMQGIYAAEETKTVYIDFMDEKGSVLSHLVSPVIESGAAAQFDIPANYSSGALQVRAYTKWMLNFDTAFLYNKTIPVLQKTNNQAAQSQVPTLRFFPEGGDLVAGIQSNLAFKANDQYGLPVMVKGIFMNSAGKIIDSFRTVHNGMGSIHFKPAAGESYTARWNDAAGKRYTTAIPAIQNDGVVIQLNRQQDKALLTISRSAGTPVSMHSGIVIGTFQNNMVFKSGVDLTSTTSIKKSIPLGELPTGILTITLFDKNEMPLAERVVFINNNDYSFDADVVVQHWGLNKRARNEVVIDMPDSIWTNVSVAVTDAAIGTDSTSNIFGGLLLQSEIKGYVHDPAWYFRDYDAQKANFLDLVMLTHGWRRIHWQDIAKGIMPVLKYPKDTSYLSLSGSINGVVPGSIGANENIIMIVQQKDSASQMVMAPIDARGNFDVPDLVFFDSITVFHQFDKKASYKRSGITYLPGRLPAIFNSANALRQSRAFRADTTGNAYNLLRGLEKVQEDAFFKAKVLEAVTVRAQTKDPKQVMDEKYASGFFAGGDAITFDLVNDNVASAALNIFNYLQGRVAGLQITGSGPNTQLSWRGGTPQVYIDEIPSDVDLVSNIAVTDIAYVKVFRPPFMGGFGGAGGAIAIYTRRGNDLASTPGTGLDKKVVAGYTPIREFYSPNYQAIDRRNESRDLRTTLYWQPILITRPGSSKAVISFYNNDVSESFRIIVEGISKDGRLLHKEFVME